MREILFKGKTEDGKWEYGYPYEIYRNCHTRKVIAQPPDAFGKGKYTEIIDETLSQFTGLTDKNGTKIFEGDIVKETFEGTTTEYEGDWSEYHYNVDFDGYKIGVVTFTGTGTHLKACKGELFMNGEKVEYKPSRRTKLAAYRSEVIGNIHDNPELIGGADNG